MLELRSRGSVCVLHQHQHRFISIPANAACPRCPCFPSVHSLTLPPPTLSSLPPPQGYAWFFLCYEATLHALAGPAHQRQELDYKHVLGAGVMAGFGLWGSMFPIDSELVGGSFSECWGVGRKRAEMAACCVCGLPSQQPLRKPAHPFASSTAPQHPP